MHDRPRRGVVQRNNRDLLKVDVLPDVEFGPVGDREDAQRLTGTTTGVVDLPQLGALPLRVPLVLRRANEKMRSLARDFSSSRRAPPKHRSNLFMSIACLRPSVFHMSVCIADPCSNGLMPRSTHSGFWCTMRSTPSSLRLRVAKCVHLTELPHGVHVDQRERRLAGIERLHCQVQHDRAVFTNAVQHRRIVTLGNGLAHDVDGLCLQALQVRQSLR